MNKAIALILILGLAAAGVAWWIGADAQPVTVDEIGDENQTVPQGQLPRFAAKGDAARLYAFAAGDADTLRWMPCTHGPALGSRLGGWDGTVPGRSGLAARCDNAVLLAVVPAATQK